MKQKVSKNAKLKRVGASSSRAEKPLATKPKTIPKAVHSGSFDSPAETRIIALCNQKGGCGKTTSVINIAAGLAALGQRVLVVDLDSQCNATTGLGISVDDIEASTFEMLMTPKPEVIEHVILETQFKHLHVAPASIELSEFESRASNEIGRENRLKKALYCLKGLYDFIIIDTPPSLGLLSVNALNAANEVQIALQAQPFAFDGLQQLLETISLVREELNPQLQVTGVMMTMYDNRTKISREIMDKAQDLPALNGKLFKSIVRQNIKVTEATKMRKPVMYYDAGCTGTSDYMALSREICLQHSVGVTASKSKSTKEKSSSRNEKTAGR